MNESKKSQLLAQMHTLLDAGLDVSRMFEILLSEYRNETESHIIRQIYDDMIQGKSLKMSMGTISSFSALDANVVWAGEASGRLAFALGYLSEYYAKKEKQKKLIRSSLSYPFMILCFAFAVLAFMILIIVPTFSQVYVRMGGELPGLTRFMIKVSEEVPQIATVLLALVVSAIAAYRYFRQSEDFDRISSHIIMQIPVLNKINRLDMQCSFCRLMALLLEAGIPILDSMKIVSQSLRVFHYKVAVETVSDGLKTGRSLSQLLSSYPELFSRKILTLIRVGEESNRMEAMFVKSAEMMNDELDYYIKRITVVIEPVMVILVGVLVAIILIAMYLPMFRLGTIIS